MELIKTNNGFQYVIYPEDFIGRCLKHCGYFAPTEILFLEKLIGESINIPLNVSSGQYIICVSEVSSGKEFMPVKFQVIN
jgi:hypothetical protein